MYKWGRSAQKEGRIPTEREEIEAFFSGLERLEIVLETSTKYEYYYDLLESLGHRVVVAPHPLKTRMIAAAKIKTEKRDAKILAELLRGGLLPNAYVPPKELRELRHLVLQASNRAGTNSKRAQGPDKK
jgi:transposase